nr:MAG TPA: hypothetical protein [Caudoviricetes sp.]
MNHPPNTLFLFHLIREYIFIYSLLEENTG